MFDLQYFLFISDEDRSWHRYPEVLLYALPFALLTLWIFERVVKGPAIALLPSGVQRRLQDKLEPLSFSGGKQLASIVMWIGIGHLSRPSAEALAVLYRPARRDCALP